MNQILSDTEIDELYFAPDQQNARQFARAIEQAVIQKLREQKPVGYFDQEYCGGPVLIYQVNYSHKDREGVFPLYEHPALSAPEGLTVKLSKMEESNSNVTWSVFLAKSEDDKPWDWYQVYSDSIEGRTQYEADSLKHFLGQGPKPFILDYETDPQMATARSE